MNGKGTTPKKGAALGPASKNGTSNGSNGSNGSKTPAKARGSKPTANGSTPAKKPAAPLPGKSVKSQKARENSGRRSPIGECTVEVSEPAPLG